MQDRSPGALCAGIAGAKLVRGNFLRMTDLRLRPAYISVAVSRSTESRRVVELSELAHLPIVNSGDGARPEPPVSSGSPQEALAGFLIHGAGPTVRAVKAVPFGRPDGRP